MCEFPPVMFEGGVFRKFRYGATLQVDVFIPGTSRSVPCLERGCQVWWEEGESHLPKANRPLDLLGNPMVGPFLVKVPKGEPFISGSFGQLSSISGPWSHLLKTDSGS